MSSNSRMWRQSGWLACAQLSSALVGLATTTVLARHLGPQRYGKLALALAFPTLIFAFSSLKPMTVATRYLCLFIVANETTKLAATCKLTLLIDVGSSLVTVAIVAAIGHFFAVSVSGDQSLYWAYIILAMSFPLMSLQGASMAVLTAASCMRAYAVLNVIDSAVRLSLVCAVIVLDGGVRSSVAALSAAQAASGLLWVATAHYVLKRLGAAGWWRVPLQHIAGVGREFAKGVGWTYLSVSLSAMMVQGPVMILGYVASATTAGYYRIANAIASAVGHVEIAAAKVAYPELTRLSGAGHDARWARIRGWSCRSVSTAALLCTASFVAVGIGIPVLFGADYAPMILGAQIMAAAVALGAAAFWAVPLMHSLGRFDLQAHVQMVYAIAGIGIGVWVAVWWGFLGMSIAVAACRLVYQGAMAVIALRKSRNAQGSVA